MLESIASRLHGRSFADLIALAWKNFRHLFASFSPKERARRDADLAFDRRWGTDTSLGVSVHDLGFDRSLVEHCRRYDPSTHAMLADPVKLLGIDPAECDFIDYGAGKGRVVMYAMEMGFKSVVGVELSAKLCEIALMNVARFSASCPGIPVASIVKADATVFEPTGRHILAYFYNPFGAQIVEKVRRNLEKALADRTDMVTVIYVNSEHHHLFGDAPGWIRGPTLKGLATFTAKADKFRP